MSNRIHILCEAVAFVVVMIYFQIRVNQLNKQIRDIQKIVAEQQTVLQKHEDFIANYILNQNVPYAVLHKTVPTTNTALRVVENPPVIDKDDDVVSITESDLDKELTEELEELMKEEEENKNETDPPSEDVSGNHES